MKNGKFDETRLILCKNLKLTTFSQSVSRLTTGLNHDWMSFMSLQSHDSRLDLDFALAADSLEQCYSVNIQTKVL